MSPQALHLDVPTVDTIQRTTTSERATDRRHLDEAVARLQEGAQRFLKLSLDERVALARSMQAGYLRIAEGSVKAACVAKGITVGTPLEGEEWMLGPWMVVRHLRLVQQSLLALKHTGNTPIGKLGQTIDGRLSVQVFPAGPIDGMLFNGVRVDVHLQPGIDAERMHATRARFYKKPDHDGKVVLVLGAGNVNAIPSHDVITKLFNEGKVCILKMHPVNAYLGPYLEEAFGEAISKNFLAVVYGGADEGDYLVKHPGVGEIHMTGSDRTFDLLVWGPPGPEREARKASGRPLLEKPITAELGNVSPVIVVPGPYSERELLYQAEDVAGTVVSNAAFVCNSTRMLISPAGWSRREAFLQALERTLGAVPVRKAYYPGAVERWRLLTSNRGAVRTIGRASGDTLPWTLLTGLDPNSQDIAFRQESFCSILSETSVGSPDPVEFLEEAVSFANEKLWGTLAAGLIVHPKSLEDPRIAEAVERAVVRLRYGTVSLNVWSGDSFAFGTPPWGGHPSTTLADVQSGLGWVHNTPMLEGVEKAVLRHPITMKPKPAYFPTHRTAHTLMRRLTYLEERASWSKMPGVLAAAMRA